MAFETYRALARAVSDLVRDEKWRDALELVDTGLTDLPGREREENHFSIMMIRSKALANCGMYEESFEVVSGLVDRGMPCPPWAFDRIPFGSEDRMIRLKEKNARLTALAQQRARMEYNVCPPDRYSPAKRYPLFIALHGDGHCNKREFSEQWTPDAFVANGFLMVYVQSSQVRCHDGYGWLLDPEAAHRDLRACFDAVCREYAVDAGRVFIGGYSGGAITALDVTLSGTLPVQGFIALCPEIIPASFTAKNVALAAGRGTKGVFLEGSMAMPVPDEEKMAAMLNEAGLPLLSMVNEGFGHEIPGDFTVKARAALQFVSGSRT